MGWRIALTDLAEADLESAVAFIARSSPEAAERVGLELVAVISHSTSFRIEELPSKPGRRCANCRIVTT